MDRTGRLVTATVAGATTVYTYQSGSGNLETVKPSTEATRTFAYDAANRVSNVSVAGSVETTYTWDAAGRRIAEGPLTDPDRVTYAYDAAGRLATYSDTAAGVTATYTYDARGQRTQMTVTEGGVTTTSTYTYDGLTLLSVATAASDGATSTATYLADSSGRPYGGVFASSESTAVAFGIVTTDRGDVRALTDELGVAFAFYAFDAYGDPRDAQTRATSLDATTSAEVAGANVLRYAAYAYDAHSGLYYCSARYYDPATASFITKDPAKADGEESAYQYCGGDPVGRVDPSGLKTKYVKSKSGSVGNMSGYKTIDVALKAGTITVTLKKLVVGYYSTGLSATGSLEITVQRNRFFKIAWREIGSATVPVTRAESTQTASWKNAKKAKYRVIFHPIDGCVRASFNYTISVK